MNGEGGKHQEEGFVFVLRHKFSAEIRFKFCPVLPRPWLLNAGTLHSIPARQVRAADDGREIVALMIRLKPRTIAEMPFPNVPR